MSDNKKKCGMCHCRQFRILSLFLFLFIPLVQLCANQKSVNYSPAYFGPNANPVPLFGDALIPAVTTLQLSGSSYFGFGDNTNNLNFVVEIPLLPKFVSFKIWTAFLENYKVTQDVFDLRKMKGNKSGTIGVGDFYVQTRILIAREKKYAPDIILNSTLKTASGDNFDERRYFDTPGYYFDIELGKSMRLNNSILSEIRTVVDIGFFCWETTNSTQNDAFMYGGKIILSNRLLDFENMLAGYTGWMKNGDAPLVYSSKLTFKMSKLRAFAQYQYGITDFPYHHFQAGVSFYFPKLTPRKTWNDKPSVN